MKQLVVKVFDFDDTLATSHGYIRVLHYELGRPIDTVSWLNAMGISCTSDIAGSARMSTESFAKYSKITNKMEEAGALTLLRAGERPGRGSTDIVDFEGVSRLHNPQPVKHTIALAKRAQKEGHKLGIITGRSGAQSTLNVLGEKVPVNNRAEIGEFLKEQGLKLDSSDIHCVGDFPGGVPSNKARVMKEHFVEKYDPEIIIFYDDDPRNLHAVEAVDKRVHCIDARDMGVGWGTIESILSAARARRRGISAWSNAIKNAGIDR